MLFFQMFDLDVTPDGEVKTDAPVDSSWKLADAIIALSLGFAVKSHIADACANLTIGKPCNCLVWVRPENCPRPASFEDMAIVRYARSFNHYV